MRWRDAFIYTLREDPAEAELISHKLMLRAGMIQRVASGIYNYLPLGLRVIRKIETIIREEMERCGAAELLMPGVVPAELWRESGRWDYYGPDLLRLKDRKGNEFCLGPTHEEVVADVVRRSIKSYRDLPLCVYQIQSKFRDEVRPRYGLMRGREFIMKDAYSFHADEQSLDEMYWRMHGAYTEIFRRCGLDFRSVEADSGTIGGEVTHEFQVLADSGEDTVVSCDACEYAANLERAEAQRDISVAEVPESAPAMEEVATPGKTTIEEVSAFLDRRPADMIKMLLYSVNGGEYTVGVCIRGDLACNETKLKNALGAVAVEAPDEDTIRSDTGMPVGYLGAHQVDRERIRTVLADESVKGMGDAVGGANREGYHLLHVWPSRDLRIDRYVDLGYVGEGESCARCDTGKLRLRKGIEVGQVFKLGRKYSEPMKLQFLTETGEQQLVTMGCYGIGVGRTAAAAIEQNHDDDGIVWPAAIAPYVVTILCLDPSNGEAMAICERLQLDLGRAGIDVLLDDRDERPGVKFKDADLIGCSFRITVGARGLRDGVVEVKPRTQRESDRIPPDKVVAHLTDILTMGSQG